MFDEIQKIIYPNQLSSYDYTRLSNLLETYTEEQIIEAYRKHGFKPFTYIEKILKNKKKVPSWLSKEIENQDIDQETENDFNDFKSFIEDFRNEKR